MASFIRLGSVKETDMVIGLEDACYSVRVKTRQCCTSSMAPISSWRDLEWCYWCLFCWRPIPIAPAGNILLLVAQQKGQQLDDEDKEGPTTAGEKGDEYRVSQPSGQYARRGGFLFGLVELQR
jgi:hypothetical protein